MKGKKDNLVTVNPVNQIAHIIEENTNFDMDMVGEVMASCDEDFKEIILETVKQAIFLYEHSYHEGGEISVDEKTPVKGAWALNEILGVKP